MLYSVEAVRRTIGSDLTSKYCSLSCHSVGNRNGRENFQTNNTNCGGAGVRGITPPVLIGLKEFFFCSHGSCGRPLSGGRRYDCE